MLKSQGNYFLSIKHWGVFLILVNMGILEPGSFSQENVQIRKKKKKNTGPTWSLDSETVGPVTTVAF